MYGNPIYGSMAPFMVARAWAASAVSLRNALGSGNALIIVALEPEIPRNTTTKHSTGHKNLKSFRTFGDFRGLGWVRFMLLKSGPAMQSEEGSSFAELRIFDANASVSLMDPFILFDQNGLSF